MSAYGRSAIMADRPIADSQTNNVEVNGAARLCRIASGEGKVYTYFGADISAAFSAKTCSIAFLISVSEGDFNVK